MSEATRSQSSSRHEPLPPHTDKHVHHGKTPAAWAGSMIALVAFFVGGIGLIMGPNWVIFWIGVAMLVISLVATRILQVMGMGAK